MTRIYHVGLLAKGRTAHFQFRQSVDFLDCEILTYYGTRETTKKQARERLAETFNKVLTTVRRAYPKYDFCNVTMD